jgi:ferredoxin-type protein NapG
LKLARGELGHHYRKGWEAENQAGRPRFEQPVVRQPEALPEVKP